jgi:hypothetical protein
LVLNLSGKASGAHRTAQDIFVLDTAFALIEGHPEFGGVGGSRFLTGLFSPVRNDKSSGKLRWP